MLTYNSSAGIYRQMFIVFIHCIGVFNKSLINTYDSVMANIIINKYISILFHMSVKSLLEQQ